MRVSNDAQTLSVFEFAVVKPLSLRIKLKGNYHADLSLVSVCGLICQLAFSSLETFLKNGSIRSCSPEVAEYPLK